MTSATALPPVTDADEAVRFFRAWFGSDSERFVVVSQMLAGLRKNARHRSGTPDRLVQAFGELGLDDLIYESGQQWNLYMGVGRMGARPAANRKGGKKSIVSVPGVWVDLDTDKDGYFRDEEEALDLLRACPLVPSIVVATGTGGVHGYWKTRDELAPDRAEALVKRWWAYLSAQTDRKIDRLTNCDRLMKLPGSVRWPKQVEDAPARVRLLYANPDARVDEGAIVELSAEPWRAQEEQRQRTVQRISDGQLRALTATGEVTAWQRLQALADAENAFNEAYTWQQVLQPLGWTELDRDSEGRTIWARPGLSPWELHKSAATDYDGSHVMSLFSDSPDTGLQELDEAGVALTKYRVYIHCVWKGDEAGYIEHWIREEQRAAE